MDTVGKVEMEGPLVETMVPLEPVGQEVEVVAEDITTHMEWALAVVVVVALAFLALAPMGLEGRAALSQDLQLLVGEVVVLGQAVLERAVVALGILSKMDKVVEAMAVQVVCLAGEVEAVGTISLMPMVPQVRVALSVSSGAQAVAIRRRQQTYN